MTPARFRNWILIFAAVLVAAIAVFFFRARWLGRRFSSDVPYQLAKTIQQSTQGFTHSESRGGHTIYTLHASKAVQFKSDGHAELHDVSITLYNAQGAPANRIYGRAFDWDPVHGIASALGEVQIDFQGDTASGAQTGNDGSDAGEGKDTVHIKTSGLVFNQHTGLASTTERIEFRLSAAAGSAVGASFNSQTGVAILMSEVTFNSSVGGSPFSVRARHAQFDRQTRLLYLLQEVTDFDDNHGSSDQATIAFREDGSAYQVEAQGNVVLIGSQGQKINTRKAHIDLGAKSEPQQVKVDGGVLYVANSQGHQMHGSASSGTLLVGPQMTLRHAQMRDAVSLVDVQTFAVTTPGKNKSNMPESSSRQLQATQVDVDFVTGPDRSPQVNHILAVGGSRLNVHTIYSNTPPGDTTVQGDQLFATLNGDEVLTSVRGTGHTGLADITPGGVKQSSTGDNLLLTFSPAQAALKRSGSGKTAVTDASAPQAVAQLQSAVQQGHVTLTQGTAPAISTAVAERADYDAVSQIMKLSGSPSVRNASGELSAASIAMERTTGNAEASGGVKATYHQSSKQPGVAFSGSGPVHVVADHAHLDHAMDVATFYGKGGDPARLWQASDSVVAPVIELSQEKSTLLARGVGGEASAVAAIFTSEPGSQAHPVKPGQNATTSVTRVLSRVLLYTDSAHKATFSGGVVAQTSTGTVRASSMDVYLAPSGTQPADKTADPQSNKIERIVARGGVQLMQPGRKGTGDELTYTAANGQFLLIGTSAAPPRMSDQAHGTVTGTSLIFNDRDDSVIVSGGSSKVVTETRVAR